MAHSTSMALATAGEINCFLQDSNGKIIKVLRQSTDIKQDGSSTGSYSATSAANMGAYNQMNTPNHPQYVRIHSNYNVQTVDVEDTSYAIEATSSAIGGNGIGGGVSGNSNGNLNGNIQDQQHQPQQTVTTIKYEPLDSTSIKTPGRFTKCLHNNNTKVKSKIHTTISTNASVQRKRKPEKANKGLRHFSTKVCEKVRQKGTTTYNEVADELVTEELQNNPNDSANCDQKNIRRRVYDALNVLMAIQIISKDKKEIKWIGLPSNSIEQSSALEKENEERRERIKQKHQQLRELILQQVAFKNLIERNKEAERQGSIPTPNSSIELPFIIVNTHKSTKINCSVTNDKSEYIFKFDDKFEMHDDAEVLKPMGLLLGLDKGTCTCEDIERAKSLVPPNFEKYIEAYGNGKGVAYDSDDDMPPYIELSGNDAEGMKSPGFDTYDDEDEFLDENSDID